MRFVRGLTVLIGIGLGAVLMVSCGDEAEALSKPEFISQANAICQTTNAELQPVWERIWDMEVDVEDAENQELIFVRVAEAMDTIGPAWNESINDIRALEPPSEDEDTIYAILDDLELAIEDFRATAVAAADGDEAARGRMNDESEDPMDDVNRRAREYGLTVCGSEE
jgi:hypothetical protein